MDVRLSPEQQALRDAAAQVVDRLAARAVGQLDDGERAEKLDAAVAASGWRDLRVPDHGGIPLASGVEASIVAEELGRGLADTPFLGPTLAAELRRLAGAPDGTAAETVLLAPGLGALASAPNRAVAIDARGAASALVLVPDAGGHRLAAVALQVVDRPTDLTRPTAVASAAPVALADHRTLTDDDIAAWTALGLALTCADLVGVMRGAVQLACDYAGSRKQYGTAIGSFQAVQHLLADAFVAMEGSRSVALHAAWAVDALPAGDARAAGAVAKAYCARAAREVCETAIQVHGGIGNTWECLAHVFLRRALLSTDVLGGAGTSLARVLAHHGIDQTESTKPESRPADGLR
jgi:alkylation response protein AidB-like acyl-CoA dehydrogenase